MAAYYHKEYAPRGRDFDMEKTSIQALIEQGWVDHPGKIGVNVWGPAAQDDINRMRDAFDAGELEAIDAGPTIVRAVNTAEKEMAEIEREIAWEKLRTVEGENEALRRELRESKEKLADHRSDARKIEVKKADVQSQVPAKGMPKDKAADSDVDL